MCDYIIKNVGNITIPELLLLVFLFVGVMWLSVMLFDTPKEV